MLSRLDAFRDSICLRDARGRSSRPALVRTRMGDQNVLRVDGSFTVLQRFDVSPAEGCAFVTTTGDLNPIHTEDTVISGAMTAARFLLLPEILVPGLAVKSLRVKFRAFSRYGRPTVNRYLFRPNAQGAFDIQFSAYQTGTVVADGVAKTALSPGGDKNAAPLEACESAHTVQAWLESLRLRSDLTFGAIGHGYPRAFLASLPSGEMVRHGGAGGLLNVLDLEFPEAGVPAMEASGSPTVSVEPSRPRNTFRRVLTQVASGMVTYCRGSATVLLGMFKSHETVPGQAMAPTSASA